MIVIDRGAAFVSNDFFIRSFPYSMELTYGQSAWIFLNVVSYATIES